MSRALNLDSIAPDDFISPNKEVVVTPPKIKKIKPAEKNSRDQKPRQQIYALLENKTKHSLSSFLTRPNIFKFDNQNDEEIILVLRPHWITNFHWVMISLLMIFAPFLIKLNPFSLDTFIANIIPSQFHLIVALFWVLITFAYSFEQFLSWYFNVFIITEERIIDVDFYNLVDLKTTEANISQIQDISSKITGAIPSFFNYGNVIIQTAAKDAYITFENIANPTLVLKVLQLMRAEEAQEAIEGRSQ